jgi:hypothetical protein
MLRDKGRLCIPSMLLACQSGIDEHRSVLPPFKRISAGRMDVHSRRSHPYSIAFPKSVYPDIALLRQDTVELLTIVFW